jgi:NAD(P)H-nitrite reductase large subunit
LKNIIIGSSAAGISAAETLRREDPTCEIIMISDEPNPLYSRPLISYYLAGELPEERIYYRPPDFYERNRIEAHLGRRAVRVEPRANRVILDNGEELEYDNLLLANGASPTFPEIEGLDKAGVFGFRRLSDAKEMLAMLPQVKQAVVLGGGLVGLKAAVGLKARGVDVTVAVGSPHLLSQMVDARAGEIYRALLEEHGIKVATGMEPAKILGDGRVTGVLMESGEELPAQLVVVGKGVRANLEPVEGTEVRYDYGVIIDEHCRTNIPNIYAAGDVAQSYDVVRGRHWTNALWPCAVEQGRVAALNMAGKEAVYRGSMGMNSVQFFDLPVISAGLAGLRERDFDSELIDQPGPRVYKRLVLRGDRLVGFILVGEIENAGIIRSLVERGVSVAELKDRLLRESFGFSEVMPLIEGRGERFPEREYQELIETMRLMS